MDGSHAILLDEQLLDLLRLDRASLFKSRRRFAWNWTTRTNPPHDNEPPNLVADTREALVQNLPHATVPLEHVHH
jgi:hypothetical protein